VSDEPVLEVLARRGDLSLVRSRVTGKVGLLRDDAGVSHGKPAVTFDREEWAWLAHCAVPLARQVLGPEPSP
jgi:hypothetical protein